jgi:hypothetical protein
MKLIFVEIYEIDLLILNNYLLLESPVRNLIISSELMKPKLK